MIAPALLAIAVRVSSNEASSPLGAGALAECWSRVLLQRTEQGIGTWPQSAPSPRMLSSCGDTLRLDTRRVRESFGLGQALWLAVRVAPSVRPVQLLDPPRLPLSVTPTHSPLQPSTRG
jgi:hypothetical protein